MRVDFKEPLPSRIIHYLKEYPETRDNDMLLLSKIWGEEIEGDIPIQDFFDLLMNGRITHFESVRRLRQRIQEKNPSYRGELFDRRRGFIHELRKQMESLQLHFDF